MMKERTAAIVIGLLMVFSMAGFAMFNVMPQQPQQELPSIITTPLTKDERLFVLQTGRVLIEDFYAENCTECLGLNQFLTSFVQQFEGYAVLNIVVENETKVQMIGRGGAIRDVPFNVTQEGFLDLFCEIALYQPKECLMREI